MIVEAGGDEARVDLAASLHQDAPHAALVEIDKDGLGLDGNQSSYFGTSCRQSIEASSVRRFSVYQHRSRDREENGLGRRPQPPVQDDPEIGT
ncbi:MAG TPA: hypothetical protein VLX28_14985, partial [Thermoanaerobaculia bacterium]|nr:hypothetical protein [Thermoanaerobaculia bacterium]